jgi:hypothetical protein
LMCPWFTLKGANVRTSKYTRGNFSV